MSTGGMAAQRKTPGSEVEEAIEQEGAAPDEGVIAEEKRPGLGVGDPRVGQRIRAARFERGMSLGDVGRDDLSRPFLSQVELGRRPISLRALAIIADRLDLPMSYFLADMDVERTAELALDEAEVALSRSEPQEALRILDAVTLVQALRSRALLLRGRALMAAAQPEDALSRLQEGLRLAEEREDHPIQIELHYFIGKALYHLHSYAEALTHFQAVMSALGSDAVDTTLLAKTAVCIGHIHYVRDDMDGALAHYTRARDLYSEVSDPHSLGCIYSALGNVYRRQGDNVNALRYSKLSLGAFTMHQSQTDIASELNNLAVRYRELGRFPEAIASAKDAITRARDVRDRKLEAMAHSTLASIYYETEDESAAREEAERSLGLAGDETDLAHIDADLVIARLADRQGEVARTDEIYQRVLTNLQRIEHHKRHADVALEYSLILQKRGDTEQALKYALESVREKTNSGTNSRSQAG